MYSVTSTPGSFHFVKLSPGDDLRASLLEFCQKNGIQAGSIISCVGSLKKTKLRLANSDLFYTSDSPHEILTLSGLISTDGIHVHASVADSGGDVKGGHLIDGNIIFTTAEIVIASFSDVQFDRVYDPSTGFKELKIKQNSN